MPVSNRRCLDPVKKTVISARMNSETLLSADAFRDVAMGNHALARAMVETETRVITTYPGSPTPEIAELLFAVPTDKRPYYFEYSVNEKVALEIAAGASMNGHLSCVFFKSVGLNVAMDSMIQLPMLELMDGMVIIVGDDPGANSSQNEQDNRHFARAAHLPLLEPASPKEAYQMYLEAVRLSTSHRRPVLLRTTTHTAHAREMIHFGSARIEPPERVSKFDYQNGPYWPIAKAVLPLKQRCLEKEESFAAESEISPMNNLLRPSHLVNDEFGIIAAGLPAFAALENIQACGAPVEILKLGFTHPMPRRLILDFLRQKTSVLILEELDRVMETEIKAMAFDEGISCRIYARKELSDLMGELTQDRTSALLRAIRPDLFSSLPEAPPSPISSPSRPPQLCPGCGHRTAFFGVSRAISANDITVGDIGCHTLGALPPHNLGQIVLSMGHSVSTGSGLALFNDSRKVISFIGDGTLLHAGLPGIINAAINNHHVTLVVLDNQTTAMTGHQPRPGSGVIGPKIPLIELLKALGVGFIRDVDAYDVKGVTAYVKEAAAHPGFAVVIARHPCVLELSKKRKKSPETPIVPKITVDQQACTQCGICVSEFSCPSFQQHEDNKVTVAKDLCIGDGSCVQVCPSHALKREGAKL
jgi:indolepyruvate ferredoxin oxidoreductase alpha subunit